MINSLYVINIFFIFSNHMIWMLSIFYILDFQMMTKREDGYVDLSLMNVEGPQEMLIFCIKFQNLKLARKIFEFISNYSVFISKYLMYRSIKCKLIWIERILSIAFLKWNINIFLQNFFSISIICLNHTAWMSWHLNSIVLLISHSTLSISWLSLLKI